MTSIVIEMTLTTFGSTVTGACQLEMRSIPIGQGNNGILLRFKKMKISGLKITENSITFAEFRYSENETVH